MKSSLAEVRQIAPSVIICATVLLAAWRSGVADEPPASTTALIDAVERRQIPIYDVNLPADRTALAELPIGVFDSGIGGLTVIEALLTIDALDNRTLQPKPDGQPDFEQERFIYLADQANMPYGNYPGAGKEPLLRELILRDTLFLLGRRYWSSPQADQPHLDKPPVKAIVIACNTATAYGLEDIRRACKQWQLPLIVVGVVEAGAAGVVELLPASDEPGAVAILATVGTCSSQAYPKTLARMAGQAGRRLGPVVQHGSVGLAGAIEGDPAYLVRPSTPTDHAPSKYLGPSATNALAKLDPKLKPAYALDPSGLLGHIDDLSSWRLNSVDNYVRYDVASLVEEYRVSGGTRPINAVVLGCTHYPLEQQRISDAFARVRELRGTDGRQLYFNLISPQVAFVNPAQHTARQLYGQLAKARLLRRGTTSSTFEHQFFISVPNVLSRDVRLDADGGLTTDFKLNRAPGRFDSEDVRCVPMTAGRVPATTCDSLRQRLPAMSTVWTEFESRLTKPMAN